jgi:hypothetical protein
VKTVVLNTHNAVTLDGSGNGTTAIGPTGQGEIWNAGYTAAVKCSTNVKEATCIVYCGPDATDPNFNDGTTWGSTGDSTQNTAELRTGQQCFAVWTGGDAGARATLSISGTRQVA